MAIVASPPRAPETRPGNNFSGVTIAKTVAVKAVNATAPDSVIPTAATTDVCVGVTAEQIVDQSRGDVHIRGRVPVTAGAAFNAGVALAATANGKFIAAVSGDWVIATSVDAAVADGDVVAAEISVPGGKW
jgi:hypothetical protein